MAVSAARALVTAQVQSAWNRLRHESGIAGTAATAVVATVAVVPAIVLPSLLMLAIGARLGDELARDTTGEALRYWNEVQGVFTLVFALLGSFRFKPALSLTEFGRYPLTRADLAMAELPAAVFEVFPLLGVAGILATNAGLAWRMPAMAPLIALLAILNVVGMLSLLVAAASTWRLLAQRRGASLAAGAFLLAALAGASWKGWIETLRSAVPYIVAVVVRMPGACGFEGLVALRGGAFGRGALGISIAVVATAGLAFLAAFAHYRALVGGAWARVGARNERIPGRYRGPAGEIAGLFFKQLSRSRAVWIAQLIPLLMTGMAVFVLREMGRAIATDKALPAETIAMHRFLQGIPFLALALFLTVAMSSQIWMNQFGWDRSAIRALMLLPIAPRDILIGKLRGLLKLTLVSWAISTAGLLLVYRPSAREVIGGVAASGVAFVVTCGIGQFVSLQAPRAVPSGGMAQTPLYLSWIPMVVLLSLVALLKGIWALGARGGAWLAPALVWVALAGVVLAWLALLPLAERWFLSNREKLLSI